MPETPPKEDICTIGEFAFRDGRLRPQRVTPDNIEHLADFDEVARAMNFQLESKVNGGDTRIYSEAGTRFRWLFMIGDCVRYAVVLVEGWADFFDAMRYFDPTIRYRELADSAADAEG